MLSSKSRDNAGPPIPGGISHSALKRLKERLAVLGPTLEEHLKAQSMTEADLRRDLAWRLTWRKYLARYATEARIAQCFDERRREFDGTRMLVSHIVLRPAPGDDARVFERLLAEAEALHKEILDGKIAFAEAARRRRMRDETVLIHQISLIPHPSSLISHPSPARSQNHAMSFRTGETELSGPGAAEQPGSGPPGEWVGRPDPLRYRFAFRSIPCRPRALSPTQGGWVRFAQHAGGLRIRISPAIHERIWGRGRFALAGLSGVLAMEIRKGDHVLVNLAPFIGSQLRCRKTVPCEVLDVDGVHALVSAEPPCRPVTLWVLSTWIEGQNGGSPRLDELETQPAQPR